MTNEELRLAIAKAKGYRTFMLDENHPAVIFGANKVGDERFYTNEMPPDWPASIADAWELWDEMKEHVVIWFDGVQLVWVVYNEPNDKYIDDITVLRAICKAWLSWKAAK